MAEKFRVLIVDDHQEIRTALRANLEALDLDLDLVDVPSGEEAIVEVVGTGIDLLIADVGLPGLSGIELFQKLKRTFADMQVILITGLEDEEIHQQIAEIGADAFFFKPLKMPEFLNAVRKSMGIDPVLEEFDDLPKLTKKNLSKDITSRIADLRGELGAISINVIEESGLIAAETGVVPDTIFETTVMPLLLNTFSTTNRISNFLGKEIPKSVWYFSGESYDLFWSHIDASYGLFVITNPVTQNNDLTWVLTTLDLAIQEITGILQGLGEKAYTSKSKTGAKTSTSKSPSSPQKDKDLQQSPEKSTKTSKVARAELPKEPPKGSNGSTKTPAREKADKKPLEENEVHEFWKAASLEQEIQRIDSPDSLSFEQAQKLGFIHNGEDLN
jgi:two-component system KDP operon response regulator KdpE